MKLGPWMEFNGNPKGFFFHAGGCTKLILADIYFVALGRHRCRIVV